MQSVCSVNFFGCFHTFLKHFVPRWGSASDTVIRVLNEALERKALKAQWQFSGRERCGRNWFVKDLLDILEAISGKKSPQIGGWEVCRFLFCIIFVSFIFKGLLIDDGGFCGGKWKLIRWSKSDASNWISLQTWTSCAPPAQVVGSPFLVSAVGWFQWF